MGCDLQSVNSQFLPAEDITLVMSLSSACATEEINTRLVMHVANITDRTSKRNALQNEDLTEVTGPCRTIFRLSCASELSQGCAVCSGTYVIESQHARTNATWL